MGRSPSSDNVAQIGSCKRWFREDVNLRPSKLAETHDVSGNSFVSKRRGRKLCDAFDIMRAIATRRILIVRMMEPWYISAVDVWTRVMELTFVQGRISQRVVLMLRAQRPKSKGLGKGKGKLKGRWQS